MAKAAERIPREWTLDDYHRLVRITLRCGINVALCEMERRIVSGQSLLICDGIVINRFDFLSNYSFQLDIDDRVKVVTRRPVAGLLPGGITTIRFDPSDPKSGVRTGPGRVTDGYYAIVEQNVRSSPPPAAQRHRPAKASKPDSGIKTSRKPSPAQAARAAAIQHRLINGVHPGRNVQWDRFCHRVRADCGVYTDDPKKIPRGLTDDRITRITRVLMKRQA
jgi:hypothetical protein